MPVTTKASNAHAIVTTGWTSPGNAFASATDGVFATAVPGKNLTVNGDFGFPDFTSADIPDGATINSVTINYNIGMSAAVTGGTVGGQIYRSGVAQGTETTRTSTTQQTDTQQVTAGISLADLRTASTAIKARIRCTKGNTTSAMTGNLDFVSISVDWTAAKPRTFIKRVCPPRRRRLGGLMVLGLSLVPLPTTTGTASITVPMVTMQATASGPSAVSGVVQVIQRNRVTKRHGKVIRVKPNQLPQPAITGTAAITVPMVTVRIEARPTDRAGRVQIIPRQKRQRRHGLVIQLSPAPMQAGVLTGTASITVPMVTMTASSSLSVTQGVTTIVQRPAPKLHRGRILYLKTRRAQTVVITGTASITVPMVTVFASTQSTIVATASITVPMVSLAGTATVLVTGIGAVSVPMVTLAASDSNSVVATAAVPVPMTTMLAHGLVFDLDGSLLGPGPTEGQLFPR